MSGRGLRTFKELEQAGWMERADAYDDWLATITRRGINPLLDALSGDFSEKRLLDICTGTGHLVAVAQSRGAIAEGLDFADSMILKARQNYPQLSFRQGDGEELSYEDASFDFVSCMFGLLHFENADRAITEAFRVLRPVGRYGFTVWYGPDAGGELFDLVNHAVQTHGSLDVPLPPAPPMFRFADPAQCTATLEGAGFADVVIQDLPLSWQPESPEDVLTLIYKSVVRTPMLLERQSHDVRLRIEQAILERTENYRRSGKIEIAFPAVMVTATKPS